MKTIEWQMTGLPNSHILIWCILKIRGEDVVIILVEMPDKDDDSEIFVTINTQLIHALWGVIYPDSSSMQDKKMH